MVAPSSTSADMVSTTLTIASDAWEMKMRVTVPAAPTPLRRLIPLAQALTNAVVQTASNAVEEQGQHVSCRKGCGACCRQLVPITQTEARQIADLVQELPEESRHAVEGRFAAARQRLADAGLLDTLLDPVQWPRSGEAERWSRYFQLNLACPFLEEESCSIHADRPLSCREYLVTSPAEHCAQPTPETVHRVPLPMEVWPAMAQLDGPADDANYLRWVPLVVAPEWAAAHPDEPTPRPGMQWLKELTQHLAGQHTATRDPSSNERGHP